MYPHIIYKITILWERPFTKTALVGFYPICILKWLQYISSELSSYDFYDYSVRALSHWLHFCGFSPVCTIRCTTRILPGMYPLTVRMFFNMTIWWKRFLTLSASQHQYGFSHVLGVILQVPQAATRILPRLYSNIIGF